MSDITVSTDVDTMLRSANNAAILTNTGAAPTESPVFTGTGLSPIQFGTVGPPYVSDGHTRFTNGIRVDDSTIEGFAVGTASGGAVTGQNLTIRGGGTAGDGSTAGDLILAGGQAAQVAGQTVTHGKVQIGDNYTKEVTLQNVSLIKSVGPAGDPEPIFYNSDEHRFKDYDGSPDNLMVVQKINGYTGARVGINKDPNANDAVALHVVAGKNATTNKEDYGLKVVGGSFFNDWIRVGTYTTAARPSPVPIGTVIYNVTTHKFEGYFGGAQAGWRAFQMES